VEEAEVEGGDVTPCMVEYMVVPWPCGGANWVPWRRCYGAGCILEARQDYRWVH